VIAAADYIKHAVLVFEEMQGALSRLTSGGYLIHNGKTVTPTDKTLEFDCSIPQQRRNPMDAWADMPRFLGARQWEPQEIPQFASGSLSYPQLSRAVLVKTHSIIFLVIVVGLGCNVGPVRADDATEKAAQKAAESWMPLWDSGKCDESYEQLDEHTKQKIPKSQWFVYWTAVRKPLGKLKSRRLVKAEYIRSLPGVPDQEGATLRYESSFENQGSVIESFGMIREKSGTWRVANYITNQ
jgi:hypothetical protein